MPSKVLKCKGDHNEQSGQESLVTQNLKASSLIFVLKAKNTLPTKQNNKNTEFSPYVHQLMVCALGL
jgi:hypothetical protein